MATRYLIDTSAIIKYLNQTFPQQAVNFINEIVDSESNISFISQIELQVWNPSDPKDIQVYFQFVQSSNIFGISDEIIASTILIRKNYKLKLADALIAATAIVNDLTLLADNDKDFLKVPGLNYINPKAEFDLMINP
jgi:predicted nucleic acid-binding protein